MSTISVDTITDEAGTGAPNFPNGVTGVSSFKPVAVTGTTPSLDVGTYNYFSGATFNADTTISFASVPTNARWTYSALIEEKSSYYLEGASYDKISLPVGFYESNPYGLFFKPDGTEMYVTGTSGDDVNQFTLSTAWDLSSASFTRSFSISSQETAPQALFFKPDGTEMYVTGSAGDDVNQYALSTAWNVSTASFTRTFSVAAQEGYPVGLFFKPDGTEMYVAGTYGDDVNQYTLSTGWDISTASFTRSFSVVAQDSAPVSVFFTPDGTVMFVGGDSNDRVDKYTLSTGWDISTASYSFSFRVFNQEIYISSVFFKDDGSKMYIIGTNGDEVFQYSTVEYGSLTLPASVSNTPTPTYVLGKRLTLEFVTLNGGTTVDVIQASVS